MTEMMCPNCGRHLASYRTDRQAAGTREVELRWSICLHCRHVALDSWSFADGVLPVGLMGSNGGLGRADRDYSSSAEQANAQKRA